MAYTGSYQRGDILSNAPQSKGWEIAWKIYFFVLLLENILEPMIFPAELYASLDLRLIISLLLAILGFIGLFGYAWRERIFSQLIWKCWWISYFVFIIAQFFIFQPSLEFQEVIQKNPLKILLLSSIGLLMHIPALIAIFIYAFRSKELWNVVVESDEKGKAKKR